MFQNRLPRSDRTKTADEIILVLQRILGVQYSVPDYVHISPECQDLISRIFVANPSTVSSSGFVMSFTSLPLSGSLTCTA